jgi:uncharacterized protein YndB with AHSA1/START domain/ketosteroid isomerase-like protein
MPGCKTIGVSGTAASGDWTSGSPNCKRREVRVVPRDDIGEDGPFEITIVHRFDAPRELVFRNWTEPEDVRTWFAPDGCTVTFCEVDARPGGKWRVEYRCDFGGAYIEHGEFHEVVGPERLVFSLTQEDHDGNVGLATQVTVKFAEVDGKTEMTFSQAGFKTASKRDSHIEGWNECFRKLTTHMATDRPGTRRRTMSNEQDAEAEIRALIERWANAVQRQDIETIVARHVTNFLMFDVPPPNELNGIDAYRDSWTPFFDHFKHEGVFAIERLDVTAGERVAFATALLRCGTEEELRKNPATRLRLTVGLRKEDDGWMIAHEHQSFPSDPA